MKGWGWEGGSEVLCPVWAAVQHTRTGKPKQQMAWGLLPLRPHPLSADRSLKLCSCPCRSPAACQRVGWPGLSSPFASGGLQNCCSYHLEWMNPNQAIKKMHTSSSFVLICWGWTPLRSFQMPDIQPASTYQLLLPDSALDETFFTVTLLNTEQIIQCHHCMHLFYW